MEVGLLLWNLVEASMEVDISFHWRSKWKLSLLPSTAASTTICGGSCHELPYIPTYFHLLPRVSHTSSCFHQTSFKVHQLPFNPLPWKFPPTFMEYSMEAAEASAEVNLLPWKLLEAPMDVYGSFHWRWTWELPLLPLIAAPTINSVQVFMNFHIPL